MLFRSKSEFLAARWQQHGVPLGKMVLGHVHVLSDLGSQLAPLSNVMASSRVGRWLNEKLFGIDRRRTPPAWASRSFEQRWAGRAAADRAPARPSGPRAVLFNDTFTNFNDPEAGKTTRRYYVVAVDALGQEGFPSSPVWFDRDWKQFYKPFIGEWHQ